MGTAREIVEFLRTNVPVFADFTDERLAELVGGSRVVSFEANEAIAHQGAEADALRRGPERHASPPRSLGDGGTRQDRSGN